MSWKCLIMPWNGVILNGHFEKKSKFWGFSNYTVSTRFCFTVDKRVFLMLDSKILNSINNWKFLNVFFVFHDFFLTKSRTECIKYFFLYKKMVKVSPFKPHYLSMLPHFTVKTFVIILLNIGYGCQYIFLVFPHHFLFNLAINTNY